MLIDAAARGAGSPLLLVGPLGGTMALWGAFADDLAERYRVIVFDPRGVGRSSPAPITTTTRAMARDARAVLDRFAIDRAHVYGESLGGMVASWLAHDEPARVDRLILASTVPSPRGLSLRAIATLAKAARCIAGRAPERCMAQALVTRPIDPDVDRVLRATPPRRRELAILALAAARHRAPHLDRDALLLFGARDPLAEIEDLARDCPRGVVERVEDAGHALTLDRPHELAARARAYLSQA
ncbi:MAG TPA: alpha/beta fold hydrolase [Kofleriaceae bacterium]|nr:alpha/beta fold hydrolase [Kofleriaceae bacterium]